MTEFFMSAQECIDSKYSCKDDVEVVVPKAYPPKSHLVFSFLGSKGTETF